MENIIKNNRLIAEFLGMKTMTITQNGWEERKFNFNDSFDSIMIAVKKITGEYHRFMFKSDEDQHYCEIWCYNDSGEVIKEIEVFGETEIESIYLSVIEFIKWYNENK